jgi:hypothetical protein
MALSVQEFCLWASGISGRVICPSQGLCVHRVTRIRNKRMHMPVHRIGYQILADQIREGEIGIALGHGIGKREVRRPNKRWEGGISKVGLEEDRY